MQSDQHLDLNVPESLIMLGVYISMAEVDNIKRGLSVADGMRKGKSEGRWMGKAPAGYINKIREDKTKYIDLIEPEATHIKWSFEAIAEGIYVTEEIWLLAKKRGMKCQKNTFWDLIRNPMYCGKIIVPANKHHEMSLADGKHTPLISEELFWDVQDVLNGRKKTQKVKIETPINLPLRGFLYCPNCNKNLTGSPSKGRSGYYYYYHCKSPCKARFSAEMINADFVGELKKFVPLPGVVELFKEVVRDAISDTNQNFEKDRRHFVTQITDQNNLLTKIRTMLLQDDISIDDYKTMKFECDERILRLEAKFKQVKESDLATKDLSDLIDEAMLRFKILAELYSNGDIEEKRYIIGSIFDEKWTIIENKGRTGKPNVVAQLIYQINNMLRHKKTGVRTKIRTNPGSVPSAGVEPARFPTGV